MQAAIEQPKPTVDHGAMLAEAIEGVLETHSHLLSAGEILLLDRWFRLTAGARALCAWLVFRRPGIRLWKDLGREQATGEELVRAGLAEWSHRIQPGPSLARSARVAWLRVILGEAGLPVSGAKGVLVDRAGDCERALRQPPRFQLRDRALFDRILRLYCCRKGQSGEAWELHQLGIRPCFTGPRSTARPLFLTRHAMLESERAERVSTCPETSSQDKCALAIDALGTTPMPPRHRLSSSWIWKEILLRCWPELELDPESAKGLLELVASVDSWAAVELAPDVARALARTGQAGPALDLLGRAEEQCSLTQQIEISRARRGIARRNRRSRPAPLPLRSPPTRRLRLPAAESTGPRPLYFQHGEARSAEAAVIHALASMGRASIFSENGLWREIFVALFGDILLSPIPGQLPAPALSRPLDFGTRDFYACRETEINHRLARISAGEASSLLAEGLDRLGGLHVLGQALGARPLPELHGALDAIPSATLSSVLGVLARDWRGNARGFPDLLVLPSASACRLSSALPHRLPESHLWVEVKGPGDSLRSSQRAWNHRLLELGEIVELWELRPAPRG